MLGLYDIIWSCIFETMSSVYNLLIGGFFPLWSGVGKSLSLHFYMATCTTLSDFYLMRRKGILADLYLFSFLVINMINICFLSLSGFLGVFSSSFGFYLINHTCNPFSSLIIRHFPKFIIYILLYTYIYAFSVSLCLHLWLHVLCWREWFLNSLWVGIGGWLGERNSVVPKSLSTSLTIFLAS